MRVLLAVYAHCIPGCDQIASQHIEEALNPSHWSPLAHKNRRIPRESPSVMRPCHSQTQRDTAGPGASTEIRLDVLDLRKYRLKTLAHRLRSRTGRSRHPFSIRR